MRSIDELRELMPIENFMHQSSQYGEDNEYEGWDDSISIQEHILIERDMRASDIFHNLELEEKEELILLASKPHLLGQKIHELISTPATDNIIKMEDFDHDETEH